MNQCVHELEAFHVSMLPRSSSVCFHSSPQIYKLTHSTNKHRIKFNLISLLVCPTRPAYRGRHVTLTCTVLLLHGLARVPYSRLLRFTHISFHSLHIFIQFIAIITSPEQPLGDSVSVAVVVVATCLLCFSLLLSGRPVQFCPIQIIQSVFCAFSGHTTPQYSTPAADEDKRMREAQLL